MIIYVDGSALRPGDGTERSPFKTISEAAPKLFQVMKFLLHLVSTGRLLIRAMPELPPNGSPTAPLKKVRPISRAANL